VCAALLLPAASPARAHHGDADRYNQEVITVTGTVVEVQMVNPHAHIVLDVVEAGKTVRCRPSLVVPSSSSNSSTGRRRRSRRG
jgi:ATP phosphoribosyltransferase